MSESTVITEAMGENGGVAKWAALWEVVSLAPGLDREQFQFQVVLERQRGLLGLGLSTGRRALFE